jgi:murein DD-endopeptidase MepM/ murein hydrolase activator NlpD
MQGRDGRGALPGSRGPLSLPLRAVFLACVALVGPLLQAPSAAPTPPPPAAGTLLPSPGWYRPVIVDGFTFPVARANWLSVVEFRNDWHDPRFRLVNGQWQLIGFHEGNDILAEKGTPILSATEGVIEAVGWTFYSGTRVGVRGADGKYYFYAHLSRVAPGIVAGAPVAPGDVLGLVGNTGYGPPGREDEFPPHLHFGIEGTGGWENPFPLVRSLYRRSVAATTQLDRRLVEAGLAGRQGAFDRIAAGLFADLWDG